MALDDDNRISRSGGSRHHTARGDDCGGRVGNTRGGAFVLTPEEAAVRDLARECDPLDLAAHLIARGYRVVWPCKACSGTGTIPCDRPEHGKSLFPHRCGQRSCDDVRCAEQRHFLLRASIEADRLRQGREP
jgi:hypothetical protein